MSVWRKQEARCTCFNHDDQRATTVNCTTRTSFSRVYTRRSIWRPTTPFPLLIHSLATALSLYCIYIYVSTQCVFYPRVPNTRTSSIPFLSGFIALAPHTVTKAVTLESVRPPSCRRHFRNTNRNTHLPFDQLGEKRHFSSLHSPVGLTHILNKKP